MLLEDPDPVDHFEEDDYVNEETHSSSTFRMGFTTPSQASPPMPRSGTAQPMLANREMGKVALLQEQKGLLHKVIEGQKALGERTAALENKMAEIKKNQSSTLSSSSDGKENRKRKRIVSSKLSVRIHFQVICHTL